MMRITRRLAIVCLGGSALMFGNCTANLGTGARDGALDAWEGFVADTVTEILNGLDVIQNEE